MTIVNEEHIPLTFNEELVRLTTFVPRAEKYPELNVSLLEQFFKWAEHSSGIEGNPVWYQGAWAAAYPNGIDFEPEEVLNGNFSKDFCGTSFCAAGYGLSITGNLEPVEGGVISHEPKPIVTNEAGETRFCTGFGEAGAFVYGMTYEESEAFFRSSNTLPVLKQMARIMAERRGVEINV